jgi:outer membrane protein TolC
VTAFAEASADPNNPLVVDRSRRDTLHNWFNASGNHSYTVGGEFSIPLGNHTAKAARAQRAIELRRATTVLRREEQTVILDVRNAVRNLRSSIRGIQAAERNRGAQSETLDAEQERLRLGDSTPFQVLEHEQDLAQAERQVIFSLQVHRNAIAGLDRAQATLLEQLGISIARELQR